jgi:hypothetical protein
LETWAELKDYNFEFQHSTNSSFVSKVWIFFVLRNANIYVIYTYYV